MPKNVGQTSHIFEFVRVRGQKYENFFAALRPQANNSQVFFKSNPLLPAGLNESTGASLLSYSLRLLS
jgi:hypothetical protein